MLLLMITMMGVHAAVATTTTMLSAKQKLGVLVRIVHVLAHPSAHV